MLTGVLFNLQFNITLHDRQKTTQFIFLTLNILKLANTVDVVLYLRNIQTTIAETCMLVYVYHYMQDPG